MVRLIKVILTCLPSISAFFFHINSNRNICFSSSQRFRPNQIYLHMTGATTVERPSVRSSGPAIIEPPTVEKKAEKSLVKEKRRIGNEGWEVRIYNDGLNTREFVARWLVQVTGLSEITAYETMMQAHQNGMA